MDENENQTMNEQQRVFLTVLLCMGIFLGWQFWVGDPLPPPTTQQKSASSNDPAALSQPPDPTRPTIPAGNLQEPAQAAFESRSFESDLLHGRFSNRDASLTQLDLAEYQERGADASLNKHVSLVADPAPEKAQARISWDLGGGPIPALRFVNASELALIGQRADGLAISVQLKPRPQTYALDYTLRVENNSDAPQPASASIVLTLAPKGPQERHFFAPPADQLHALCDVNGSLERKEASSISKGPWKSSEGVRWTALDRQYFIVAVLPQGEITGQCQVSASGELLQVAFSFPQEIVAARGTWERRFSLYVGPKRDDRMVAVSKLLPEAVDYTIWHIPLGFLARPMVFLLNVFHGWTASWGVAIMLLTLLVKSLLFPVTYKTAASMRRMQLLKPELDRIKSQFENDRERQQLEQLKLFREKGVNPLGGCLPMLLQMPVWFALYRTLWSAVDLYQQPFLWLPDLTAKEPFPVLALLLGVITVIQQRLTPMTADSQQLKVMTYVMPIMLTLFMVALPSGLVLYILVNSVLTIIQQLAINKRAAA